MEEAPKRRSLLGPLEMVMLIVGLGIIAYVTFQSGGGKVMERSETIKILDKPNGSKEKARRYEAADEESVEALLQNMAEQFSEEEKGKSQVSTPPKKETSAIISADEKKYYEDVREKSSFSEQLETAKDWYQILSASQKTYSKVRSILSETTRQPEEKINTSNVSKELQTPEVSSDFYQKLSENFQIDQSDLEAFGRTGKRALSDWAEFVEEQSKN